MAERVMPARRLRDVEHSKSLLIGRRHHLPNGGFQDPPLLSGFTDLFVDRHSSVVGNLFAYHSCVLSACLSACNAFDHLLILVLAAAFGVTSFELSSFFRDALELGDAALLGRVGLPYALLAP